MDYDDNDDDDDDDDDDNDDDKIYFLKTNLFLTGILSKLEVTSGPWISQR